MQISDKSTKVVIRYGGKVGEVRVMRVTTTAAVVSTTRDRRDHPLVQEAMRKFIFIFFLMHYDYEKKKNDQI